LRAGIVDQRLWQTLVVIQRDELVQAFRARGYQLWVVGGALRDELRGVTTNDVDYATDATPDEVEGLVRGLGTTPSTVGKRFGTIGILVEEADAEQWSEITTFRGDAYSEGSRWPEVQFGREIHGDLARRDFTINAMARDALTGALLDPFDGAHDLEAEIIRTVGEPAERFREDPLRILRGLRFASQLGFEVDERTIDGMRETASLLGTLSQERITAELDKLLCGRDPGSGLRGLEATNCLEVVLPEVATMVGCEQNSFHRFDVWGHTVATVEAIETTPESLRIRRWAALLHDLGKPAIRHRKANGEWGFYRHETVGAELAERLLERLRMNRAEARLIALLVRRHMDRPDPADPRSVRRFMAKVPGHWPDLLALKSADNGSHTYVDDAYHDALTAACERAERDEADKLHAESPLTGDDLVALFDREPGPWIRAIKEHLSSMVLDGELAPGDKPAAERAAKSMLRRPRR